MKMKRRTTKRQMYKWRQVLAKLGNNPNLESREVQRKLDEAYRRIFMKG
jgi:hypothetical protein